MGGKDDLNIRIELENEIDELLLPFYVQTNLGLIHKKHVVLIVFHQNGQ